MLWKTGIWNTGMLKIFVTVFWVLSPWHGRIAALLRAMLPPAWSSEMMVNAGILPHLYMASQLRSTQFESSLLWRNQEVLHWIFFQIWTNQMPHILDEVTSGFVQCIQSCWHIHRAVKHYHWYNIKHKTKYKHVWMKY